MAINRTNDYAFKWIFGNQERKDLLLSFINSVLTDGGEEDIIKDIELIDRELDPVFYADKASRVDILGETADGQRINVEVQTSDDGDIDKRSLYYWSKIYQEQLHEGMKYKELRPTIAINILNFNYFPSEKYHNRFAILEEQEQYLLNDNLQLHFIELKKWTKLSIKARNRLERWLLFLTNNDPMELEEIAMKDSNITKALDAEKKFLSDKQARYIYDLREKAKRDLFSSIATAEERGEKRGRAEIAASMFKEGMSIEMIHKITKMDMNQLKQLQSKNG